MSILNKITPGPWRVIHELNVENNKHRFICSCGRNSHEKNNREENTANALLISYAPEMLSIIERLALNDQRPSGELHIIKQEAIELLNKLNS